MALWGMGYNEDVWKDQGSVGTQDKEFDNFSKKEWEGVTVAGHIQELWDGLGTATKPTDSLVSLSLTLHFLSLLHLPSSLVLYRSPQIVSKDHTSFFKGATEGWDENWGRVRDM